MDGDYASLGYAWEIGWAANVDGGINRESPVKRFLFPLEKRLKHMPPTG